MELCQIQTIACGFSHSVAVGKSGELYVWGDNTFRQLKDDKRNLKYSQPEEVELKVSPEQFQEGAPDSKGGATDSQLLKYKAFQVTAGNNFTIALGYESRDKGSPVFVEVDEPEMQDILAELRNRLMKNENKSLYRFFNIDFAEDPELPFQNNNKEEDEDEDDDGSSEDSDKRRQTRALTVLQNEQMSSYEHQIQKQDFLFSLNKSGICTNEQRSQDLFEKIKIHTQDMLNKQDLDFIRVGDIEDFAVGFRQHSVKMFMFGMLNMRMAAFKDLTIQKIRDEMDNNDNIPINKRKTKIQEERKKNKTRTFETKGEKNILMVSKPQIVKFPKFTQPIISVACGHGHILALTVDFQMYSWGTAQVRDLSDKDGVGNCGVLGFGEDCEVQEEPRQLVIKDHLGDPQKIIQIACGKMHSMCLSVAKNLYTWGEGSHGRLGHGDECTDDQMEPKEVYVLSQRKPIYISAGDSHCAAITEKNELYTWGSGSFGKLGHGNERHMTSPKYIQWFKDNNIKIVGVACGPCHTLAVSKQYQVFSFGQDKNGKLGIHFQKSDGGQRMEPVKISMYSMKKNQPSKEKGQQIMQLSAGFNHSMSISALNKIYSWGYNGKGLLGRPKGQYDGMALPLDGKSIKVRTERADFIQRVIDKKKMQDEEQDDYMEEVFWIEQVECGAVNTIALSSQGKVYIFGDNTYSQHGIEDLAGDTNGLGLNEKSIFKPTSKISEIQFPFGTREKIKYVSIGAEHIFAVSEFDEVYGWGRNDEGQLGVGFLTEKIVEPVRIKDISFKGICQICCGDNYSASLTIYGEVFVCGSLEGGKLGLGKGQKKGFQLKFKMIPDLPEIDYINCGVKHMFAITRFNPDRDGQKRAGRTYAWGKNQRAQLGINNKETKYSPTEIQNTKERFKKVCAGINYSIGLSHSGKVYFWGNYKYYCDINTKADIEEPQNMSQFDFDVADISCNYKNVCIISDKGDVYCWGRYLLKKQEMEQAQQNKADDEEEEAGKNVVQICKIDRFPKGGSAQSVPLTEIKAGSNHTVGIGHDQRIYTWGYNNVNNRLGLRDNQPYDPMFNMVQISVLQDLTEHTREHIKHAQIRGYNSSEEEKSESDAESDKMEVDSQINTSQIVPVIVGNAPGDVGGREGSRVNQSKVGQSVHKSRQQEQQQVQGGENEQDHGGEEDGAQNKSNRGKLSVMSKSIGRNPQSMIDESGASAKDKTQAGGGQIVVAAGGAANKDDPILTDLPNFTFALLEEINLCNLQQKEKIMYKDKKQLSSKDLRKKDKTQTLCILDRNVEFSVIEFIRQDVHVKKFANIPQISKKGSGIVESLNFLQKILKKEESNEQDEKHIQALDKEITGKIQSLMKQINSFGKFQLENAEIIGSLRTSFQSRIIDIPFNIDNKYSYMLKEKEFDEHMRKHKKIVRETFSQLQLHPCYIINFIKSGMLDYEAQKALIQALYKTSKKTDTLRLNFLLVSIFEKIFPWEIRGKQLRLKDIDIQQQAEILDEDIDLFSEKQEPKMISTYIFRQIFQSQYTNVDTVATIICHMANIIITGYQQHTLTESNEDATLDLADKCGSGDSKDGKKGGGKGGGQSKGQQVSELIRILRQVVDDIKDNNICKDSTAFLQNKKNVQTVLDYMKKQFKFIQELRDNRNDPDFSEQLTNLDAQKVSYVLNDAGLDADHFRERYPSFRLSEEVIYMLSIVKKELSKPEYSTHSQDKLITEDSISTQILGLVFYEQADIIWQKPEIYLFPYLQKTKMATSISNFLKVQHKWNLTNLITVFRAYLANHQTFKELKAKPGAESWLGNLNKGIQQIGQSSRTQLAQKILNNGKEISEIPSYVNFENTVIHALEQEDSGIHISKKLIGTVIGLLIEHQQKVKVQNVVENDVLLNRLKYYHANQELNGIMDYRQSGTFQDNMINIKLKTRIMAPDLQDNKSSQKKFVRCLKCNATLTKQMAVQNDDANIVIELYQPQDNESLMHSFCEVLQIIEPLNLLCKRVKELRNFKDLNQCPPAAMRSIIEQATTLSRQNQDYHASQLIQKFRKKLIIDIKNTVNKDNQSKPDKEKHIFDENCEDYELDCPDEIYDKIMRRLCKFAERKVSQRIQQDFQLRLIKAQIEEFLVPHIAARIEQFKKIIIIQNKTMKQNLLTGLANHDCEVLIEKADPNQFDRMKQIIKFKNNQRRSDSLHSFLNNNKQEKKNIRGYLLLQASDLLSNKTITEVKLKELQPLIEMSQAIFMESEDGSKVEFKMVYQEVQRGFCSKSKVLEEHVLMKLTITQKEIKRMRKNLAQHRAEHQSDSDTIETFEFEGNDAIKFDTKKFLNLLTEMERKKLAYILKEELDENGKPKGRSNNILGI